MSQRRVALVKSAGRADAFAVALREAGVELIELAPDDRYPDCCFIEDRAVVCGDTGLVTRSAAASRQGEAAAVEEALPGLVRELRMMRPPATLDGGPAQRPRIQGAIELHRDLLEVGPGREERVVDQPLLHRRKGVVAMYERGRQDRPRIAD